MFYLLINILTQRHSDKYIFHILVSTRPGCCHVWCQCFLTYGFNHQCGGSKVFYKEDAHCIEAWLVEECQVTTDPTTTTTKRNTCNTHTICTADGFFEEGPCSSEFCECYHGIGWLQHCQQPFKFDESTGTCRYEEDVYSCHPTTPEISSTTTTSTTVTLIFLNSGFLWRIKTWKFPYYGVWGVSKVYGNFHFL